MFEWLFEGLLTVYIALLLLGLLFVLLWWRTRKRAFLLAVAVVAALAGIYFLLDLAVESPSEQITRKVREMAAAAKTKDVNQAFTHVSRKFTTPGGKSKEDFRQFAANAINQYDVKDVIVWDFHFLDPPDSGQTRKVRFPVKVLFGSEGQMLFDCEATFQREREPQDRSDQWRLTGFELFWPGKDEKFPLPF